MNQPLEILPSLREVIETYHRSLRWDSATQQHRDPFIQRYRDVVSANPGIDVRLRILLILVNARFDQGTVAERAMENTRRIFESGLLNRDAVSLEELPPLNTRQRVSVDRWRMLFHHSLPKLRELSSEIAGSSTWTAGALLRSITSARIPYFGPKTARLAVRWLSELVVDLTVDMSDSEVPVDSLVYRVAARLGLIDPELDKYWGPTSPAHQKIQQAARQLFPRNPSLVDEPLWMMGRQPRNGGFCYPKRPSCDSGCLFSALCPRLYADHDPSDLGYSVPSTNAVPKSPNVHDHSPPKRSSPRQEPRSATPEPVAGLLVIVSCVKNKIWDIDPAAPARSPAGRAYVGSYFTKNREYARMFGESWCVLSAKYGLVLPDEEIENYNFTFKHRSPELVTVASLIEQVVAMHLDRFRAIQVLGGKEYVDRVSAAFAGLRPTIEAPLSGFRIGESLQAVQGAVDRGVPLGSDDQSAGGEPWMATKQIQVPPAIRRIASSEDRKLAWQFFVFFSRMEYALKRSGRFLLKARNNEAKPAWDDFGSSHDAAFKATVSPEVTEAVDYFRTNPPRKQIVNGDTLSWAESEKYNERDPLLTWLLVMIRRVRNNLFHGGKFPLIPIAEPSRDQELILHAIAILHAALSLDNDVQRIFLEDIDA